MADTNLTIGPVRGATGVLGGATVEIGYHTDSDTAVLDAATTGDTIHASSLFTGTLTGAGTLRVDGLPSFTDSGLDLTLKIGRGATAIMRTAEGSDTAAAAIRRYAVGEGSRADEFTRENILEGDRVLLEDVGDHDVRVSVTAAAIGPQGPQGRFDITIWRVTDNDDQDEPTVPADPSGGSYNIETATITPPTGWTINPSEPATGQTLFRAVAHIDPRTDTSPVTPSWSHAFEIGSHATIIQTGPRGDKGWSPIYALVADGQRIVERLVAWVDGEGTQPAGVGRYKGADGLVSLIADAVNVKGADGEDGLDGTVVVANPSGTGGNDLTRITIAGTDYNIPEGGGEGGGGLNFADLPGRNVIHSNHEIIAAEDLDDPYRIGLTHVLGLFGSSAGLGPRLNPNPESRSPGDLAVVNADRDGYSHTSGERLPPDPSDGSPGDALFRNDDGDGYHLGRIVHPDNSIPQVGLLPDATSTSPRLVLLTHDYVSGNRMDATLTVGFDGSAAGYTFPVAGRPALGHVNRDSPLSHISGIVTRFHSDGTTPEEYRLDSIYSFSETWLDDLDRWSFDGRQLRTGRDIHGGPRARTPHPERPSLSRPHQRQHHPFDQRSDRC